MPNIVDKGWGYEEILTNTPLYCAKILHVNRGKQMSWHYHNIKDETFYVDTGSVWLYWGWGQDIKEATVVSLFPGDSFHVPPGMLHRLYGRENARVFEFSTEHFEDDSIRIIKGD